MEHIPIAGPWITQKEIDYVTEAVTHGWYSQANLFHERFETAFAAYVGRKYAIALPSCTSALHLSLLALGVGPGDEVIVPDATWIATAAPITYVGATPVFADIDPNSWCLDATAFEQAITPQTKAVIVVDLYGNMPDYGEIQRIAAAHNIALIEDAAEAIGSTYQGKKAGSFGKTSTFSFHGSKTMTTGEGGMLVTDQHDIYDRCLFLRDHGRATQEGKMFWNSEVAFKYRMSAMQAALGLAQLERIDELIERKRQIFGWYQEVLGEEVAIQFNSEAANVFNTYWMVTVILPGLPKEQMIVELRKQGIDCRPFFYPLSTLPAYANLEAARKTHAPVTAAKSPFGLNLPSALCLERSQVHHAAQVLKELVCSHRQSAFQTLSENMVFN
jgi:perosamine synthetase